MPELPPAAAHPPVRPAAAGLVPGARPAREPSPRLRALGAVCLAATTALAMGLAELAAVLTDPRTSPVSLVGGVVVDLAPAPVKDLVIAVLGTADKPFLLLCVLLGTLAIAAGIGTTLPRRLGPSLLWCAAVAVIAASAAVLRIGPEPVSVLPALVLAVSGIGALLPLRSMLREAAAAPPAGAERRIGGAPRRRLLATGIGLGAVGALAPLLGRGLRPVLPQQAASITVPAPAVRAPQLPPGLEVPGISPLRTEQAQLYRIDTALVVPGYEAASWRLRIEGMVERPYELGLSELLALPMVEHDATLLCVSNPVGGDLVGSVRFQGVRVRELFARAVPREGADQVLSTSVDGFTAGTPLAALTDDREALVVVAINGEPLTPEHGAPARLFTPGLYGYVGATKWLTSLRVGTFGEQVAYWTTRGWAEQAPVKTSARIDTPRRGARLRPDGEGLVTVAGVAWAVHRGIGAVQVQADAGQWRPAELSAEVNADYWRQWVARVPLAPGTHALRARAADASGAWQEAEHAPPAPDGAQGYHEITVIVEG